MCRTFGAPLSVLAFARPHGRAYFSAGLSGLVLGKEQQIPQFERAEGPAVNSHARKGVVRDIDKMEG